MCLIYKCDSCNKEYTQEQYSKLEIVYIYDDRSDRLVSKTRKCDKCNDTFKL